MSEQEIKKNCTFTKTYKAVSDYMKIPPRQDLIWDIENIYNNNEIKRFDPREFEHQ